MNFDRLEYLNGVMAQAPQELTIEAGGRARYVSHTNETTPDVPEIGIFEALLPAAEIQSLADLLANPPLAALPDHSGRVPSGDGYRSIRVLSGSTAVQKHLGAEEPVDAGLRRVLDRLDQLIALVLQHPRQVLRVELAQPAVDTGILSATMLMSSAGTEPVGFRHPSELLRASNGWLSIHIWSDRPGSRDMLTLKAARVEDLRPLKEPQVNPSVVVLPPKLSASFRLHIPLPPRRSGPHLCRVSYASFADQIATQKVIRGELLSKPVRVVVP